MKRHIIDCKQIKINEIPKLEQYIRVTPPKSLGIIQVLGDKASDTYTRNKVQLAKDIGIEVNHIRLSNDITLNNIEDMIISSLPYHSAIILQLPLPKHLQEHEQYLLDLIPVNKDVDGLSTLSIGKLHSGQAYHKPCTAQAVLDVLDTYNYNLEGKDVLIIGRQSLLGYPLARMMTDRNATVTLAHSKTKDLKKMLSSNRYNVVVSAIGRAKFLNNIHTDFIIDVGINRDEEGKLCGDVDLDACHFDYATTVGNGVGGIGQLTTINLMKNVVGYKRQ